ncbi:MAG: hypothetical protein RSE93_04775 [Oscillospiraceae bacterium]
MKKLVAVLLMIIILTGCQSEKSTGDSNKDSVTSENFCALAENDPLAILEFSIGDSKGEAKKISESDTYRYVIFITLSVETDFKNCVANLVLPTGAEISGESPCLKEELSGRPILDLTLDKRYLIIENNGEFREYDFEIALVN